MKAEGISYRKACALLIGVENNYPLFGRLEDIFVVNSRVLFYVTMLETEYFNDHLHAYVITDTSNRSIVLSTQIQSHIPMHIHRVHSRENEVLTVIVCKYHVCET